MRLYLETSVWNFYYADDAPDKRDITREFFDKLGEHEIYISEVVAREIARANADKQTELNILLEKYKPYELELDNSILTLAEDYIKKAALPARRRKIHYMRRLQR